MPVPSATEPLDKAILLRVDQTLFSYINGEARRNGLTVTSYLRMILTRTMNSKREESAA